ncbi:siroheme synthase, partial [Acinetobacter baumannii]|nr:siroheme synthase [Acinetobacter baumannii]
IVDRSPLVVAISSSGTAPVLARLLREKIEALLPANLGQMAEVAGQWRDKVKQRYHKMSDRRRFWERAFNGLFASQMAAGNVNEARRTLDRE